MASDSLISVIGGLIRRENRMAREEKAKLKAAEAAPVEDEEEDEDEAPVGDQDNPETEPEDEEEPAPEPEEEPEEDEENPNPEGDTKPTGPDPSLVAQVAAIVKQEIKDEEEEKKETEIKLSGKKEKINTKPKLEQELRKGKMNFKEALRMSVTGTHLTEGFEQAVLDILEDENIDGPLGYEPFFEKGKLYVEKGSEKKAEKVLKQSRDINKVPKIVGEELTEDEYLQMEAVAVDGRLKGFKEALKRLTYEKLKSIMKKEGVEMPEGLSSEGAAEFMAAASAAKREGKKKFKFGGKEYPVTIKVDIPSKKESVEEHKGTEPHKHPHEEDEIEEASSKKARNKAADEIEAIADKGGAEAPTLFSLANKLRKGTHSTTGLKLSKKVTSILKDNGIKEETLGDVLDQIADEAELEESQELQAIMALDDAGIKAEINRKGQVVVKKKDKKKAHIALEKSFKKGGWPPLKLEDVENDEEIIDEGVDLSTYQEMKMSAAAKKKRALWAKTPAGKKSAKKAKIRAKKIKSGAIKIDKAKGRAMAKARKKGGIRNAYEIVSEARNRAEKNKPEWDNNEDSRLS